MVEGNVWDHMRWCHICEQSEAGERDCNILNGFFTSVFTTEDNLLSATLCATQKIGSLTITEEMSKKEL